MKRKIMRLLGLLMVLVLIFVLEACGGNNSTDIGTVTGGNSNIEGNAETTSDDIQGNGNAEAAFTVYDNDEDIYMAALGEFYDLYEQALSANSDSERYALMAAAEGKLLESGAAFPLYTSGSSYLMTRLVYRTGSYALWCGEQTDYGYYLITNEIIKADDYAYLQDLWNELSGTGTYRDEAKTYLTEKGYTFCDTFYGTFDDSPTTWDILSDTTSVDDKLTSPTIDYLYAYDSEGLLQPHLAVSYEVSDDEMTYTFHIREGLYWTDSQGREIAELTADDWVAAAQHMCDTDSGDMDDVSELIEGLSAYLNGETTDFSTVGIKAADDYTLVYTLTEPCSYFMSMMETNAFYPMNRNYFISQGGAFGQDYEEAVASSSYLYGTDQDHIAYIGAFLCTNMTDKNSVTHVANPNYWDAENVTVTNLYWKYDDGTDVTEKYNNFINGGLSTLPLNDTTIAISQQDGYFDEYAVISDAGLNTFMLYFNMNREAFENTVDGGGASIKTDEEKEIFRAASQNQHFRLAVAMSVDRATYVSVTQGENLKYACVRNTLTPGTFAMLDEEVTISVNGTELSFPEGTYYGAIVQAVIDLDGFEMTVWDESTLSSDGFDGWYNPENAMAELEIAIEELATLGYDVTTDNPITIDYPYTSYSENGNNQGHILKESIESALGGLVIVNLVETTDGSDFNNHWYYVNYGYEVNQDLGALGGIGADYGDPSSYLSYFLPYGDGLTYKMGLW